jgi:hypothetical protein
MIKNKAIRLELGNTPMKNGMVLGVSIPYEKKKNNNIEQLYQQL